MYLWQLPTWPHFQFDANKLRDPLEQVRFQQGRLLALAANMGQEDALRARETLLTEEVVKNHAIEGETLNQRSVWSSVARRLGTARAGMLYAGPKIDAAVDVLLDATTHYDTPLSTERLCAWHRGLFPDGWSGMHKITAGAWRTGEMRVVSGPVGHEVDQFQAPPPDTVPDEMATFLTWFNRPSERPSDESGILRAGMAHLWFVTIHPFEDGNGRLARIITDMALARDEKMPVRLYSLSSRIMSFRNSYYDALKTTQDNGSMDITPWLQWFCQAARHSMVQSETLVSRTLFKSEFWREHGPKGLNERQAKVLNKILDAGESFEGKLTAKKYWAMSGCGQATATRDLQELTDKGILLCHGLGRNVHYTIAGMTLERDATQDVEQDTSNTPLLR